MENLEKLRKMEYLLQSDLSGVRPLNSIGMPTREIRVHLKELMHDASTKFVSQKSTRACMWRKANKNNLKCVKRNIHVSEFKFDM